MFTLTPHVLFIVLLQVAAAGSREPDRRDTIIVTAIVLQVLSLLGQQEVAITSHLHISVIKCSPWPPGGKGKQGIL